MCLNVNCYNDKINYWCMWTELQSNIGCKEGKLHWSPNPKGVCDFLGYHKWGLRFTGFAIYCYTGISQNEYPRQPHTYSLPCMAPSLPRPTAGQRTFPRAYRQLQPTPLSCIIFEGKTYVDLALAFGSSGAAWVWVTPALAWILQQQGHHALVYVNDYIGCERTYLAAWHKRPSTASSL